jgi:AhpD family alkylhydroperoxidase
MTVGQYVEIISVVAHAVVIDMFTRGVGLEPFALPVPIEGAPSRRRPKGAKQGAAWVPWIEPGAVTEAEPDLYRRRDRASNIRKAMSLVPAEVTSFFKLHPPHNSTSALTSLQIELMAARVSILNQCAYCATGHTLLVRQISARDGEAIDPKLLIGAAAGDGGILQGAVLIDFVESVLSSDDDRLARARTRLSTALGDEALIHAAALVAFFDAVDRVANATGIPLDPKMTEQSRALRAWLGVVNFAR